MEIRDPRTIRDFQKNTFSGHPRNHVCKVLSENIQKGHADYACYWSLELLCSGLVHTLWHALFVAAAQHVNRAQPNVFPFLADTFEAYMPLEHNYPVENIVAIRNHPDVRAIICKAAATIALCRKNKLPSLPGIKPAHDFHPATIQENLRAPSQMYAREVLKQNDPYALTVATNELCYALRPEVRDLSKAFYWVSWIIALARETKKQTKEGFVCHNRPNEFTNHVYSKDLVWLFWECAQKHAAQARPYVDTLFKMYCLRWNPSCRTPRQPLLLCAMSLICDAPSLDTTPVTSQTLQVENLMGQVPQWLDAIQRTQQTFSHH